MNEQTYHRMNADIEAGGVCLAALEAILKDHWADNVAQLYRSIYKYTPCGPWLSVKLHDGTMRHCDELHDVKNGDVRGLMVGSIVEGSDAEVFADLIDLLKYEDPEEAVAAFSTTVDWVNDEACALWDEADAEGEDEADAEEEDD